MRACAVLVAALTGCFSPTPASGIACGDGEACPLPLVCSPRTTTCERTADAVIDAPVRDDAVDAPVDALIDASLCATGHDEDSDGVVDACDNCPTVANATQADTTEATPDGVGNACDPHPTTADRIAAFHSFASPPASWDFDQGVSFANDQLVIAAVSSYVLADTIGATSARGVLQTRYHVDAVRAGSYHSVEVVATRSSLGTTKGYRCMTVDNNLGPTQRAVYLQQFVSPYDLGGGTIGAPNYAAGLVATLTLDFGGSTLRCNATNPVDSASVASPEVRTGTYGVSTQFVDARFDYLILYEPVP